MFFGLQSTFANEMPVAEDAATLDLLETLFEEGEMKPVMDPLTGALMGYKFTHESINESDQLSFRVGETVTE